MLMARILLSMTAGPCKKTNWFKVINKRNFYEEDLPSENNRNGKFKGFYKENGYVFVKQYLDKGAKYPAEHNVGHLYEAENSLQSFYKKLDPTNTFNPGIGKMSKYQGHCSCCHL